MPPRPGAVAGATMVSEGLIGVLNETICLYQTILVVFLAFIMVVADLIPVDPYIIIRVPI